MDESIKNNEINWHRENVVPNYKPAKMPESAISLYRRNPWAAINSKQFMFKSMGDLNGAEVLDFGSGVGINGVQIAMLGAKVRGFDICPELVDLSNELARLNGVADRCRFEVGEATTYPFEDTKFDVILIDNVLHHIPTGDWPEIMRRVRIGHKWGGKIIIREPIEYSRYLLPLLKWLIRYKPEASPDEHELNQLDVRRLRSFLFNSGIRYYGLFGRLATPRLPKPVNNLLLWVDRILLFGPGLRRFAGYVVIVEN